MYIATVRVNVTDDGSDEIAQLDGLVTDDPSRCPMCGELRWPKMWRASSGALQGYFACCRVAVPLA